MTKAEKFAQGKANELWDRKGGKITKETLKKAIQLAFVLGRSDGLDEAATMLTQLQN